MNDKERKELYKLFQEVGRTRAIKQFAAKYSIDGNGRYWFTDRFVMSELDHMIDDAYSMAL